jgi:mannose-6-phosphate isomerase
MACSDNVVRAGLTPKYIDVETLCDMLTYDTEKPKVYRGDAVDECLFEYVPPVEEFRIAKVVIPKSLSEYSLKSTLDHAIVLVLSGSGLMNGKEIKMGGIFLIKGGSPNASIKCTSDSPLVLFRCSSNIN